MLRQKQCCATQCSKYALTQHCASPEYRYAYMYPKHTRGIISTNWFFLTHL